MKKSDNYTLTKEEIENNHIVQNKKSYFVVFGILALSICLLIVGSLFRNNITPDYPLVFIDANNKLMVITKTGNSKNDITNIEDANIVYANEDIRYILYTNNTSLYLLDTTSGGEGTLLSKNVKDYSFSSDDEAVYYIEQDGSLYVYIRKDKTSYLIDSNVKEAIDVIDNYVVYGKDNSLLIKDYINLAVDTIANSYGEVYISEDYDMILYATDKSDYKDYYIYNIKTTSNNKILNRVYELLNYNPDFTEFIYTSKNDDPLNIYEELNDTLVDSDRKFVVYSDKDVENGTITEEEKKKNDEESTLVSERNKMREYARNYPNSGYNLYYQLKETKTLLASGVIDVYVDDYANKRVVYTKNTWNNILDLKDYNTLDEFKKALESNKTKGLYYQINTDTPSLIKDNIGDNIELIYKENDGVYYIENTNLYYSQVFGRKASSSTLVDSNLITTKLDKVLDLGVVYLTSDNNSLKYVSKGRSRLINQDVYREFIEVSETEDAIYYLRNYANHSGTLMLFNGIRNSKLSDNVSSFIYINDELMYATKDYDEETKTSDLYRLNGSKFTFIYKGILEWFSPVAKN